MSYCPACGNPVPDASARFCMKCGRELPAATQGAADGAPAAPPPAAPPTPTQAV
ncbi:MAG: zinc-ribbon domain-containing protein, partial [Streptomyces sp.]|nr:zinc-ribbon domain-containing protein [Streptomyces sp.]